MGGACRAPLIVGTLLLAMLGRADVWAKGPKGSPQDIDVFLTDRHIWEQSPASLMKSSDGALRQGLCKTELMYANRGGDEMKFLDSTVDECVVRLDGQKAKNLYVLIAYGDEEKHLARVKNTLHEARTLLEKRFGRGEDEETFRFSNGHTIAIRQWSLREVRIRLYASDEMPNPYVSVLVEPASLPARSMEERLHTRGHELPAEIRSGTAVCLAVPMRHQLRGIGACASATLCRQLAYLGTEFEPQMTSQMMARDEDKQLDAMGRRLGFYRKSYDICPRKAVGTRCVDLLNRYNALAVERRAAPVKYKENSAETAYGESFERMDNRLLKTIPVSDPEKYALFRNIVMVSIDQKIPVSWTVVRAHPKDGKGGGKHRRMIIGYDTQRDLVFFSDPWGFHEDRLSMPFYAAFAMTVWMQAICPDWLPESKLP